ncbi:MAG: hypothetical protein GXP61_08610 [Epsilonproteobacteria bacterium]|nr:hypothetical protein [Campylobacterota bacterium]
MIRKKSKINNYLNRGIIEANLDFAKEKNSIFSIIKFNYAIDLDDAYTFKDLIAFIHKFTDFSPILQEDENSFIIFLKDAKIHQAKAIVNKMNHKIYNMFDFEIKNIGITVSSTNDTYKKIIDRVDKYFVMSKLSSNKKVFYGTVDFDYYDTMQPLKVLKNIFSKNSNISINNIYKGIPITEKAKVNGFNGGIIQVNIKADRIPFYKNEKFTFIQHDSIPDIIKADILKIDKHKFIMVLGNLQFLQSSPIERSDIRIEPKKKIHTLLAYGHKKLVEGFITNISEGSISFEIPINQMDNMVGKNLFHKELTIKFQLANSKKTLSVLKLKAYIFSIVNNLVVVNISPGTEEKTKIREYVSTQQNELLSALKQELLLPHPNTMKIK